MTMRSRREYARCTALFLAFGLMIASTPVRAAESPQDRMRGPRRVEGYYKGRITPHWFAENTCFWYRNDLAGSCQLIRS